MVKHYRRSVQEVELYGPSLFHKVLDKAQELVKTNRVTERHTPMYHILVVLTDGNIHDMRHTTDRIVECSPLPLSIIIVGIGDADFTNMEILDGDEEDDRQKLYDSKGEAVQFDIVQFVQFNKFKNEIGQLAEQVLCEVPDQCVNYMSEARIKPGDELKK